MGYLAQKTAYEIPLCDWSSDVCSSDLKWGVSWQITPRVLTEAMAAGGAEAKRAADRKSVV